MKRLAYLPFVVVAAILIGLFVVAIPDAVERARAGYQRTHESACESLQATASNPVLGRMPVAAPDFELKDWAGRSVRLSSLRGNVVLVNFWATWCKTCEIEIPSMEKLVTQMQGKPFRLLAVSVDDEWQKVREYFRAGTPLEVLLDPSKSVPASYGTDKFPETFVVDRDGQIRYYVVSDRDWSHPDIAACLESLLD